MTAGERIRTGIPGSPGLAVGRPFILGGKTVSRELQQRQVPEEALEAEIHRLHEALKCAKLELAELECRTREKVGAEHAAIFEAHQLMLEDPELVDATVSRIRSQRLAAECAFQETINEFVALFEEMKNEMMRQRAADLRDISRRVLARLMSCSRAEPPVLDQPAIIVAHDLSPSETASLDRTKVLGLITEVGGATAHAAILARAMGLPAVLGVSDAVELASRASCLAIDGSVGEIRLDPSPEIRKSFEQRVAAQADSKKSLAAWHGKPSRSRCGRTVRLEGNIGSAADIDSLLANDAEGVGLFRTEFLYMQGGPCPPTEDEQFEAYRKVLSAMAPRPVIIRTLDVGGDKEIPSLGLPKETNAFLGFRAIRYCLDRTDVFKTQLRALLRASGAAGSENLGIMFPMVSSVDEVRQAKLVLRAAKQELAAERKPFAPKIRVGIMIEIPSAALISDTLSREVDFFSIGSNDLIQYTCAVDRMNQKVAKLYDPRHPAVLRLIDLTIRNGHAGGIPVGMCGEMAGDPRFIPLLLGMGLDEFSMSPNSILAARAQLAALDMGECQALAERALKSGRSEEIAKILETMPAR